MISAGGYYRENHDKHVLNIWQSHHKNQLVGGFNSSEKYKSKWESSPNRVEHEENI